jgi:hypothetical protein
MERQKKKKSFVFMGSLTTNIYNNPVYSNIPTFVFSLAALTYKNFCASRHINVTLNRSATECAQSVSGTCLFYLFIPS